MTQTRTSLEEGFERACWDAIAECSHFHPPYNPHVWQRMIGEHGARGAAERLVVSSYFQDGFKRLLREGRLDLTVEFAILDPAWDGLFETRYREAAAWRLRTAMRDPDSIIETR